jgi:hypothetical protein
VGAADAHLGPIKLGLGAGDPTKGLPATKARPTATQTYIPSEADPTRLERMTTTAWHPNWALKAREAEPKKMITWVYSGQSDPIGGGAVSCVSSATTVPDGKSLALLCARYEQATTDATGALGVSEVLAPQGLRVLFTRNEM